MQKISADRFLSLASRDIASAVDNKGNKGYMKNTSDRFLLSANRLPGIAL